MGPDDVLPGETARLLIPFYGTVSAGSYDLLLRAVFTSPGGARTSARTVVPLGRSVEIVLNL